MSFTFGQKHMSIGSNMYSSFNFSTKILNGGLEGLDDDVSIWSKNHNDENSKSTSDDSYNNGARVKTKDGGFDEIKNGADNIQKNKSKLFYSEFVPHTIMEITEDSINTETITMSPEITQEEKENGVVKKERIAYSTPGYLYNQLIDSHKDVFTYDDNTELTNYYDGGSTLNRQQEITYTGDPNNPKDGDKKTVVRRIYNPDGTCVEIRHTYTYNKEFGGFGKTLEYNYLNESVYDAEGNKIEYGTPEYKNIRAQAGMMHLGTNW